VDDEPALEAGAPPESVEEPLPDPGCDEVEPSVPPSVATGGRKPSGSRYPLGSDVVRIPR
jgi:hypothetical protein